MNADPMPLIGAAALIIVGFFIVMKGGSKWGWLFIAGAVVWAYTTMQPVIRQSQTGTSTPEQSRRGYYKKPGE